MATTFEEIYDLALVSIVDYKLNKLYAQSETDFATYLKGLLLKHLSDFTNCKYDLDVITNVAGNTFTVDLNMKEKSIIANLLVLSWWEKETYDATKITSYFSGGDIKRLSEANNLKEKRSTMDEVREKISQEMMDYGLINIPIQDWIGGNFIV